MQRTLQKVEAGLRKRDPGVDRKSVAEVERELQRLVVLASKAGDLDAIAAQISALEAERTRIKARLAARPAIPDMDRLREAAEGWVRELRTTLEGHDGELEALGSIIVGRRLWVGADPKRGFRIEGLVRVAGYPPPASADGDSLGRSGGLLYNKREVSIRYPCGRVICAQAHGFVPCWRVIHPAWPRAVRPRVRASHSNPTRLGQRIRNQRSRAFHVFQPPALS